MSEPSKIRWLTILGYTSIVAGFCSLATSSVDPVTRHAGIWGAAGHALGLILMAMFFAAITAVASRRLGHADPTRNGMHVGMIAVVVLAAGFIAGHR